MLPTPRFIFTVEGEPKGKGRPRMTKTGHVYTPDTTTIWEGKVWNAFKAKYADAKPIEGAFEISIHAFMPIPKSASKKKTAEMINGTIPHTKKPDVDNIAKAAMDALNGTAFVDDSACVNLCVMKHYGQQPRLDVLICEV